MLDFNAYTVPAGETIAFPVAALGPVQANEGNAPLVLGLLELLPDDPAAERWGRLPVAEFAERVALAEALDLAAARPSVTLGRCHEIGASPERIRGILAQLGELARAAAAIPGASIGWG